LLVGDGVRQRLEWFVVADLEPQGPRGADDPAENRIGAGEVGEDAFTHVWHAGQ
jgi:hypothetical protein